MMRRRRGGGGAVAAVGVGLGVVWWQRKAAGDIPSGSQTNDYVQLSLMKGFKHPASCHCYVCAYGLRFSHFSSGYHCIQLNGGNKIFIVRGVNVVKRSARGG